MQRSEFESGLVGSAENFGITSAFRDFGLGTRRIYRPKLRESKNERPEFTGEREGDAEVWSWLYFAELPMSRAEAEAFADSYNKQMRKFIADPTIYRAYQFAATQPARLTEEE
jgi:hypothetical protein